MLLVTILQFHSTIRYITHSLNGCESRVYDRSLWYSDLLLVGWLLTEPNYLEIAAKMDPRAVPGIQLPETTYLTVKCETEEKKHKCLRSCPNHPNPSETAFPIRISHPNAACSPHTMQKQVGYHR